MNNDDIFIQNLIYGIISLLVVFGLAYLFS